MNKVTLTALTAVLVLAGTNTVFASEESRRGEAADPQDSLPRDNQEDLPSEETPASLLQQKPVQPSSSKETLPVFVEETGFIEGSHLSINLKNQYSRRHYKHAKASRLKIPADWKQWAQGVSVDYTSGYGLGFFGIDASVYGALKLDGNNPQNAPDELLHTEKDGTRYSKTYSRIGRLNAKFRLGNERNNAVLRYGLIGVDTALLADNDSRLLESSYRGASVDANLAEFNDLRLYGFYLDRIAFRAGNGYERFLTSEPGKPIDNIQIYGVGYTFNNLGGSDDFIYLNGEYGISKDYVEESFAQLSYNLAFDKRHCLLANVQYRHAEKAGNLWKGNLDGFDKNAQHFNANIMSTLNSLKLALSYSHTVAKNNKSGATGDNSHQFRPQLAANDYGKGTYWTSRQVSNFNYDQEDAYQAMIGYDFAECGANGLNASLTHTYGTGMNKATGLKNEQETDIAIGYDFQQPALKGLSLQLEQAWYTSRNISGSTVAAGKKLTDLRVYAKYNLAVF